jgi:DNA-directed RNA polymerase subunit M/transcription elongation factor TFIIS
MHFCTKCHNMYYLKINNEVNANELIYYCRNCGHEDQVLSSENICVSRTDVNIGKKTYEQIVNEFTKLDPTLPRTTTIKCPNQDCLSNKDKSDSEVIYLRYDDKNMKYIYLCSICDTLWKTDEQI